MQSFVDGGQSVDTLHATHVPASLHTVSPAEPVHGVPAGAAAVPHVSPQVATLQAGGEGQSHWQTPASLHVAPPVPHDAPAGAGEYEHDPAGVQLATRHGTDVEGQSAGSTHCTHADVPLQCPPPASVLQCIPASTGVKTQVPAGQEACMQVGGAHWSAVAHWTQAPLPLQTPSSHFVPASAKDAVQQPCSQVKLSQAVAGAHVAASVHEVQPASRASGISCRSVAASRGLPASPASRRAVTSGGDL